MSLEVGIVGLPNVGKSTLFNALTAAGAEAQSYAFCTIEPNVGVVPIPDERLDVLAAHIDTDKVVPATVRVVDIAGLVSGASRGEGLGNKFLGHVREVDAVVHVVRCFESEEVVHVGAGIDPVRDVEVIDTELMLADMQVLERAADKIRKAATHEPALRPRLAAMDRCHALLSEGRPLRGAPLEPPEREVVGELGLISEKRVLYVANVGEGDLPDGGAHARRLRAHAEREGSGLVVVCSKLEAELRELTPEEQREMLAELGLEEPALRTLAREAYRLLDLQSFFTVGPKEIRARAIPAGATAIEAAGKIHSDFARGFIRAEIHTVEDLERHGSEAAVRAAGKLRTEGRDYVVQDGDVMRVLFNV